MKRTTLITMALIAFTILSNAQEQTKGINKGLGLGFQINQFQKDFGLGLSFTSPYFGYDRIAVRLRGNLMYNENIQNLNTTWTPYANISLGLIGVGGMIGDHVRLYGEGGVIGLLPSADFSSKKFEIGGYGLFGFEFFMNKSINYFIELGGVGTGAKADKIAFKPIYSNGFLIDVGFRVCL